MKFTTAALLLSSVFALPSANAQMYSQSLQVEAIPQAGSPDLVQFQQIEDKWADAITQKDQYALELILAPSYVDISAAGVVSDRDQQIAHLLAKGTPQQILENKTVSVRILADAAIVNGTYILHDKKAAKGVDEEKGIFTHVFQRGKNGWLCVSAQRTAVTGQSQPKGKQGKNDW